MYLLELKIKYTCSYTLATKPAVGAHASMPSSVTAARVFARKRGRVFFHDLDKENLGRQAGPRTKNPICKYM
jgi:hypothetical protein